MNEQNTTVTREYPVGIQDFGKIRRNNYMYVDKTELVYKMISVEKYVFLNRPLRFGKSLLCSTLKYFFEGRRDLFKGLAIEQLEQDWTAYPVLHFSLSCVKDATPSELPRRLRRLFEIYEEKYGQLKGINPGDCLSELVRKLYKDSGRRVVVILDEYDAPLLKHLEDQATLATVRDTLLEFYSPLKDLDPYLRFCFITGITKFPQPSIFCGLNNLENISMDKAYATICGITESELHRDFEQGVKELSEELECSIEDCYTKLKEQYDGYHFVAKSEDIYNPFSLIRALKKKSLDSFWFESGTPSFLIKKLKQSDKDLSQLDGETAASTQFDIPTEAMTSALTLLYQSGYLTIKGYHSDVDEYVLGIPNKEVRVGLADCLLPALSDVDGAGPTRPTGASS